MYEILKTTHLAAIATSISLFVFRGGLMIRESPNLRAPALRVLPHVIDTVLLASGLGLIAIIGWELFSVRWLQVKLTLVIAYIVTGSVALKYGRSRKIRLRAFMAALLIVALIVATAITRRPLALPATWG